MGFALGMVAALLWRRTRPVCLAKSCKIECVDCNKGYSGNGPQEMRELAVIHAGVPGHPLPARFRFVWMETYILVVGAQDLKGEDRTGC